MDTVLAQRFDSALKTLAITSADRRLYASQEGTDLILQTVVDMFDHLQSDLAPYSKQLRFSVSRDDDVASIHVSGPANLAVYLEYPREPEFTRGKNRLKIFVGYKSGESVNSSSIGEPGNTACDVLFRQNLYPIFDEERQVFWTDRGTSTQKTTNVIIDLVIEQYLKGIETHVERRRCESAE
jgi:hypothetical protein